MELSVEALRTGVSMESLDGQPHLMSETQSDAPSYGQHAAGPGGHRCIFPRFGRGPVPLAELGLAVLVGALAGCAGAGFHRGIEILERLRGSLLEGLRTGFDFWGLPCMAAATGAVALLVVWMVRRFAPEAAGSGVQETEGALEGLRPMRWWRVLPVKAIGGLLSIGSGMVLGREGPTIQVGAACGRMLCDATRGNKDRGHVLMACGAAGGLSAAFNAPLAGILFVFEEMRPHFQYSFLSTQSVILAAAAADVALILLAGPRPDMPFPDHAFPGVASLPHFALLGLVIGVVGAFFNRLLLVSLDVLQGGVGSRRWLVSAPLVGAVVGVFLWQAPAVVGNGGVALQQAAAATTPLLWLAVLFGLRLVMTTCSYGTAAPGGIFAPLVVLGTLLGVLYFRTMELALPETGLYASSFALAGMGALFAATVRAPLTGIALVAEMTGQYTMLLPLIVTCTTASLMAEGCGGRPIYAQLLERTLERSTSEARFKQSVT